MFELKIYNFALTWVEQTLDTVCFDYIRRWKELPVSACVKEFYSLNRIRGGMGRSSLKFLSEKLRLSNRYTLKNSKDEDVKKVWVESSGKFIESDVLLQNNASLKTAKAQLCKAQQDKNWSHIISLKIQGQSLQEVICSISRQNITLWSRFIENSSSLIYNFACKSVSQVLPTAANLVRWKITTDSSCPLCKNDQPQTNKHVLANCSSPIALSRYTNRHNEVLQLIMVELCDLEKPLYRSRFEHS